MLGFLRRLLRRWRPASLQRRARDPRALPWPDCDTCAAPLTTNPACAECLAASERLQELLHTTQLDSVLLATFVREENRIFKLAGYEHRRKLPPKE